MGDCDDYICSLCYTYQIIKVGLLRGLVRDCEGRVMAYQLVCAILTASGGRRYFKAAAESTIYLDI